MYQTLVKPEDTWVSVATVIVLAGAVAGGAVYLNNIKRDIREVVSLLGRVLKRLTLLERAVIDDPWSTTDMLRYAKDLARRNVGMDVPDPMATRAPRGRAGGIEEDTDLLVEKN